MSLDTLRAQFPALQQPDLIYLDNAATTQKPTAVLEAMQQFYQADNANVHRGAHRLSARATRAFEGARDTLARFINAPERESVLFTRGTTEAMNLLASSLGGQQLQAGDLILIDTWAHHASIVPWQQAAQRAGARLCPIPLDKAGQLDEAAYLALLAQQPRVVILTQVANALGARAPLSRWLPLARAAGAITIVDGAQGIAHDNVDVQALGCDFYAFSGHKMYGPTGIGVLWGRKALLEAMPPYQFGGEMIHKVSFEQSSFNQLPFKFEAGTPAIAEAVGLCAAAQWLMAQDRAALAAHESVLLARARTGLASIEGITLYSAFEDNAGSLAFNVEGEHHQDVGIWLDQAGIAVRCGHHCCQPLMAALGVKGTCRVSVAAYNTAAEIDAFVEALRDMREFLNDDPL
ncbi:aminotransferase class V-fold PLP-dependent enzyme [Ferrimonas balearica]|uniref:aminotransferase class V-fold PLP-dependent enzyme n=1 Tax=Ferrimonas balearica TaxID=44012 RepID=UPI001C98D629|nr:cysteine desulfurase [Ferrimonas balearica]MBY5981600.1 cysteine desulfurase [Ferrimonas balearica]